MYVEPLELFNVELGGLKSTILHLFRSPNISLPLDLSILLQTSSNHTLKELYVVRLFALEIKFLKNKLVLNSLFGGLDFLSTKFLYVSSSFISGNNNSRHLSKIRRHFCSNVFLILVRIFADSSLDFPL